MGTIGKSVYAGPCGENYIQEKKKITKKPPRRSSVRRGDEQKGKEVKKTVSGGKGKEVRR